MNSSEQCRLLTLLQDRGNIGNARLMGMPKDLGLNAQEYFNILMIFCEYRRTLTTSLAALAADAQPSV